jgi:hypothetical protein
MTATVRVAFKGSPDGNTVHQFMEGEVVSPSDPRMSESLWATALREGWIAEAAKASPANKARKRPSNK